MIYFKFLRPAETNFIGKQIHTPFEIMFVPKLNDPIEKFCYAKIPKHLLESFVKTYGLRGEIVPEKEFPDNILGPMGRIRSFTIITPKDAPKSNLTTTIYGSSN